MPFSCDCPLTTHIFVLPRLKVTSIQCIKTSFLRANSLEPSTTTFPESSLQRFNTGIFLIEYAGSLQSFMIHWRKGLKTISSEVTSTSSRVKLRSSTVCKSSRGFQKVPSQDIVMVAVR
ncbi:hypothetical protein TNIN_456291 [Trichonephila inaurata madagascariensis]|uniref:Uncharacterized protein n=1 Tax=Trichonephila inaurata madagascariensis TaxID=2747483 RepID=A0A8X6XAU6_9ARAC|nr:hypothetical protein TNIN_456291 [Trichonephila inaurata madagascariensis]